MSESGHSRRIWPIQATSAIHPDRDRIADIKADAPDVRFVPIGDIRTVANSQLFDHLVGAQQHGL